MIVHLEKLSKTLSDSARKGNLSQSLLLVGRQGIGKFSLVMDIARVLLCEKDMSGCGKCSSCREVNKLNHPDFPLLFPFPNLRPESKKMIVFPFSDPVSSSAKFSEDTHDEIERFKEAKLSNPYTIVDFDKKENIPVELVKDMMRTLSRKPLRGQRRVAAVLDIDKMAFGAADLFLKTVEEPPADTHVILTTSRPDLLLPTLLSRAHLIKIPPAPPEKLEKYLTEKLGINKNEVSYLTRISGGSPGGAIHLYESDITRRRDMVMTFFEKLLKRADTNLLVDEVNRRYGLGRVSYDEVKLDFEIMESIIHDLHLARENRLDNHMINVDIKKKLLNLECPDLEVLNIWKKCCAETKQGCLVNNVAAGTGMIFFYISCAEAMRNSVGPKFKLP